MPPKPRRFPDYQTALKVAFDEEIAGRAYFLMLARKYPEQRQALQLIARIEAVTASILRPPVTRAEITPGDPEILNSKGQAEAAVEQRPWLEFVWSMANDYPAYIQEMTDLLHIAPSADRAALEALVAHEQAIVDFALAETRGDSKSMQPLIDFLRRHGEDQTSA
ncbi:hypothetical protein KBY30_16910 [Ruegeria pomeroyi]|nr:hypothetical protein [Ruegeria pomeroyi]